MTLDNNGILQITARDNVAVVVNPEGLSEGTPLGNGGVSLQPIPMGHKVAVYDIMPGAPIVKYGETIGYARLLIRRGTWITSDLLQ